MNLLDRLKYEWNKGSMIVRILMMNVLVFIISGIAFAVAKLFNYDLHSLFIHWMALHSNLKHLLYTPWTIITYGFLHADFWHILFNMLWLYWIGQTLEEYIGTRKILPIYIYGVLLGGLFYILAYNVFPLFSNVKETSYAVGASAGVMAIIWATVTLLPHLKIRLFLIGSVPLLYVAIVMSVLDLLGMAGNNAGGKIAHLGGALMGFIYIKQYQRGYDLSRGFNRLMDKISTIFQKKQPNLTVKKGKQSSATSKKSATNVSKSDINRQKQLDVILDKIGESGYDSLSEREKEFLFQQSKK